MSERRGEDRERSSQNPYEAPRAEVGPPGRSAGGWFSGAGAARRLPPAATQFAVPCPCGRSIAVAASHAGSTVACECGADVKVPSLGRLRELSGKAAYESGVIDTIQRMIRSGELPAGDRCAVSRKPTDDVLVFEILVPRFFRNQEDGDRMVYHVFGVLGVLLRAIFVRAKIDEEGATTLRVPLRVALVSQWKVRGMSQRRRHRLLRSVPVYATLLEENPYSRVSVAEGPP